MQAIFFKTNKKINSTAQPSGGTTYDVNLKEDCSILNPKIILKTTSANVLQNWNYCLLPNFARFYFIDEIIIINKNETEVYLSVDPLATYKSYLETYFSGQLARCSDANQYNDNIVDSMCHSTTGLKGKSTLVATWASAFTPATPSVTGTIFGDDGTLIINSSDSLTSFIGGIFWDIDWWNNFVVGGQSPQQYVKDVIMLPLQFSSGYVNINDKDVGKLEMDISHGKDISNPADRVISRSFSIDLTGYSEYNDFRDYDSNFIKAVLQAPFIGSVNIDPKLLKYDSINGTYLVDMGTGDTRVSITASATIGGVTTNVPILITSVNVGVPVAFTAETINANMPMQLLQDVAGLGGAAFPSSKTIANPLNAVGNIGGNAFNVAADVASLNAGGMLTYTTCGSNGNMSAWEDMSCNLYLSIRGSTNRVGYTASSGRPCLGGSISLSSIAKGSFCQFINPSIGISGATNTEVSIINNYLANGFYYED